jgi:hypothetical protein
MNAKVHVRTINEGEEQYRAVSFGCPGCGWCHFLPVDGDSTKRPVWGWNNEMDMPTLTPSILMRTQRRKKESSEPFDESQIEQVVCHSFVTNGRIQFLGDCTHALAGQTVDLPDIGETA